MSEHPDRDARDAVQPLDAHLQPAYDEQRISGTWNRIAGARQRRPHRASRAWILAAAGAMAIAITVIAWPKHHDNALATRDPAISAAPGSVWTRDVLLDDNSHVGLDAGARVQVLANDGSRFSTLLESGTAHYDVTPGGPRRWEIETPLASVEVVGTAFTVALDDHRLVVEVARGTVVVHGELVPGRVVRLVAGERIVVDRLVTAAASVQPQRAPDAPVAPPPVAPAAHAPHPAVVAPAPHAPAAPAPATAHVAQNVPAPASTEVSIADVIAEADRLSASGDPAGAAAVLEKARARDGLVSFALGRIYLDRLGKPELAATAFADVITRGKPHALIEDAYARRVEALLRAGTPDAAKAALADYARAFPAGRRLAALRELVGKPGATP